MGVMARGFGPASEKILSFSGLTFGSSADPGA